MKVLVGIFALLILVIVFFSFHKTPCANFHEGTIKTPTQNLSINIASSSQEQAKGLGGCTDIPKKSGMYFPFTPARKVTFWMKDMVIPIDIVWIREGLVIGVEENVPFEAPGMPDQELPTYESPQEVDGVLEVKAGKAKEYELKEGAAVIY